MRLILIAVIPLFLLSNANADYYNIEEIQRSSVRVEGLKNNRRYFGSGTIISRDSHNYYIITNGHVVDNLQSIGVRYITEQRELSLKIPATVKFHSYIEDTSNDCSILSVKISDFGSYRPKIIPLARNGEVSEGDLIYGIGFPNADWSQFWLSKVISVEGERGVVHFTMPPVGGQSGSGIIKNIRGRPYVVGLVTWWRMDMLTAKTWGAGVSIDKIRSLRSGNNTVTYSYGSNLLNPQIHEIRQTTQVNNSENDVCRQPPNGCGKHRDYHFLIIDKRTNVPISREDGTPKLFCPTDDLSAPEFSMRLKYPGTTYYYVRYDQYNKKPPASPIENDGLPPNFWDVPPLNNDDLLDNPIREPSPPQLPEQPKEEEKKEVEKKPSWLPSLSDIILFGGSLLVGGGVGAAGVVGWKAIAKYLAKRAALKAGKVVLDKVKKKLELTKLAEHIEELKDIHRQMEKEFESLNDEQ